MRLGLGNTLVNLKAKKAGINLLNGLISHWKLNSVDINGVYPDSHGGLSLSVYASPTVVAGKIGNAASFNYNQALFNDSSPYSGDIEASISFWVKRGFFQNSYSDYSVPFGCEGAIGFFITDAGEINFDVICTDNDDNILNGRIPSSDPISDNAWHFITGVFSKTTTGRKIALYIDGSLNNSDEFTVNDYGNGRTVSVSGGDIRLNSNNAFDFGMAPEVLDSMSIWNRALTNAEITKLYNGGAGLDYQNF
jgi:hypothetical protein